MADLTRFADLNKGDWERRWQLVAEEFPRTVDLDWHEAFNDIDLIADIMRDILKLDQSRPGRSGPRPPLERRQAEAKLRQYLGKDFTELPFREAFKILADGLSHRKLAAKIGVDRNLIQKLLAGSKQPTVYDLEVIARAYGKDPSYFVEYRAMFILSALWERFINDPIAGIDLYKKLAGRI